MSGVQHIQFLQSGKYQRTDLVSGTVQLFHAGLVCKFQRFQLVIRTGKHCQVCTAQRNTCQFIFLAVQLLQHCAAPCVKFCQLVAVTVEFFQRFIPQRQSRQRIVAAVQQFQCGQRCHIQLFQMESPAAQFRQAGKPGNIQFRHGVLAAVQGCQRVRQRRQICDPILGTVQLFQVGEVFDASQICDTAAGNIQLCDDLLLRLLEHPILIAVQFFHDIYPERIIRKMLGVNRNGILFHCLRHKRKTYRSFQIIGVDAVVILHLCGNVCHSQQRAVTHGILPAVLRCKLRRKAICKRCQIQLTNSIHWHIAPVSICRQCLQLRQSRHIQGDQLILTAGKLFQRQLLGNVQ